MSFDVSTVGDHRVIGCAGALDLSSLPQLSDLLDRHVGVDRSVVLDLDGITVIDATTAGVLIAAAHRQREAGKRFTVVCSNPAILERLTRLGLADAIALATSIHDIASA